MKTYIDSIRKFRLNGWTKRGEVQDRGVDQPSNSLSHDAAKVLITSESLNHHSAREDSKHPDFIDLENSNSLNFDSANDKFQD